MSSLAGRSPSYTAVGTTHPADLHWPQRAYGFRTHEETVLLGSGPELWLSASTAVLRWGVKTRSGFTVEPDVPDACSEVVAGQKYLLTARIGLLHVREPAFVVQVVDEPDRRGFAYGTLEGHPVSGEEAFIVYRDGQGGVWLTLRSITRAPSGRWRLLFPIALLAQRRYRARYRRALADGHGQRE